ncbi:MAG: hypothetical protein OEN50_03390, partial [Deltaproteobacteria bacterium]|nr:hypothetical protein [Deltaproteobacteria bacterium]
YFLRHGEKNALVPQTPTAAVGRLLACGFPPFYSADALEFTLHFFEKVAKAVPCDEIAFVPDQAVVKFIVEDRGLKIDDRESRPRIVERRSKIEDQGLRIENSGWQ